MSVVDTAALRPIAEAATPGPWEGFGDYVWRAPMDRDDETVAEGVTDADAAHIAAFDPPTVLALLAELDTLRAEVKRVEDEHRDLVSRLGFGDNITEPMADNDTVVRYIDERMSEASEWVESQMWRQDCYLKGHSESDDCFECDPRLQLDTLRATVARIEALADKLEAAQVKHLRVTARSAPDHRPCESAARAHAARLFRAALVSPTPDPTTP